VSVLGDIHLVFFEAAFWRLFLLGQWDLFGLMCFFPACIVPPDLEVAESHLALTLERPSERQADRVYCFARYIIPH
jgi:hypothetical protein